MTLLENLLVAQHNKLMRASGFTLLGLFGFASYRKASPASIELAKHWLEKARLVDRADDPAGDLPYGAQRRLEIARAMCTEPELLCLDEPAAGLNPRELAELNALLNDIKDTTGTSILLIEHDMSVVMQISDHVVVLEYGRKISDGDPDLCEERPARHRRLSRRRRRRGRRRADRSRRRSGAAAARRRAGPAARAAFVVIDDGRIGDGHDRPQRSVGERVTVSHDASRASQIDARSKARRDRARRSGRKRRSRRKAAAKAAAETASQPAVAPGQRPRRRATAVGKLPPASRLQAATGRATAPARSERCRRRAAARPTA